MNKKGIEKEYIVKMLLMVIALVVVIVVIFYFKPLKESLFNLVYGNETTEQQKLKAEIKNNTFIADNFLADFESCIKSSDKDCYCPFQNTYMTKGTRLVFRNVNNNLLFAIYPSTEDACEISTETPVKVKTIEGTNLYFENVYGKPSVDNTKLDHNDFTRAETVNLAESKLCSSKDVKGSNSIDFSSGIVYKLDNNNIALTRNQQGLKRCTPPQQVPSK